MPNERYNRTAHSIAMTEDGKVKILEPRFALLGTIAQELEDATRTRIDIELFKAKFLNLLIGRPSGTTMQDWIELARGPEREVGITVDGVEKYIVPPCFATLSDITGVNKGRTSLRYGIAEAKRDADILPKMGDVTQEKFLSANLTLIEEASPVDHTSWHNLLIACGIDPAKVSRHAGGTEAIVEEVKADSYENYYGDESSF